MHFPQLPILGDLCSSRMRGKRCAAVLARRSYRSAPASPALARHGRVADACVPRRVFALVVDPWRVPPKTKPARRARSNAQQRTKARHYNARACSTSRCLLCCGYGHSRRSGHCAHRGVRARHTSRPSRIKFKCSAPCAPGGHNRSMCKCVWSAFIVGGRIPSRPVTRFTCVSTGNAGLS